MYLSLYLFIYLSIYLSICTYPCESGAPATKSARGLTKVLRLPRNLHLTLRKRCACRAAPAAKSAPHLAKVVLRLSNLAKPLRCRPNRPALRAWSECAPRFLRPGVATKLTFEHPKEPKTREGCTFSLFYSPATRTRIFLPRAYSFYCHLSQRASFQLVAVTRKFLLSFL